MLYNTLHNRTLRLALAVVGEVPQLREKREGDDDVRDAVESVFLHRVSPPIRAERVVCCCIQPLLLYTPAAAICKGQMLGETGNFCVVRHLVEKQQACYNERKSLAA